jgi:hypothetical protein
MLNLFSGRPCRGVCYFIRHPPASLQPEEGDALVGRSQVGVAAQLRHRFQQGQHHVVEDGEVFARDEVLDDAFLLPQPERLPQPDTQRPPLPDEP